MNASKATVQLNAIVNAFIKPTDELTEALKKQGYESGTAFLKAKGLTGALDLLQTATGGSATKLAKLTPNVRALRGIMALSSDGAKEYKDILKQMGNAAGATNIAFKKQEKVMATLKSSYNKSLVLVGNLGKVFVDQAAQGATTAANSFNKFITSSRGMDVVSKLVGGIAAGFKLFKIILKPLVKAIFPALKDTFNTIKETLGKVFGKTKKSAGGFSLLAQATTIVASAFTITAKIAKFLITGLGNLIIALQGTTKTIGTFFRFLTGKAKWSEVKAQAAGVGKAIKDMVSDGSADIKDIIKTSVNEFKAFKDKSSKLATKMSIEVKTAYSSATEHIKENYATIMAGTQNLHDKQKVIVEDTRKNIEINNEQEIQSNTDKNNAILTGNDLFRSIETQSIIDMHDYKVQDAMQEVEEEIAKNQAKAASANKDYYVPITTDMGIYAEYYKARQTAMQKTTDDSLKKMTISWKTYYEKIKGATTYTLGALQNLSDLYFQSEVAGLEDNTKKKNKERELQFNINKGFKIAQVWVNAADATMGWWAAAPQLGPIAGAVFAGVMTGATLALAIGQTALIAQQKFIPQKAAGGLASGFTQVNERGGEILNLPDNTLVIPNDISRQIASGTRKQGNTIYVNFDGAQINNDMDLDYVVEVVSNKLGEKMRLA